MTKKKNKETFSISPLQFTNVPKDGLIEFLGRRGCGKTTITESFCQQLKDSEKGMFIAMCGSEKVKREWRKRIPPLYCVDQSEEYIERLYHNSQRQIAKYDARGEPFPPQLHVTLIIDDCSCDREFMGSKIVRKLASNSRHWEMRVVILAQGVMDLHDKVRDNLDLVILVAAPNKKITQTLFDEALHGLGEMRTFGAILRQLTDGKGRTAVIDCMGEGNCQSDRITYFEEKKYPLPIKELGDPWTWAFSKKHFHEPVEFEIGFRSSLKNNNYEDGGGEDDEDYDEDPDTRADFLSKYNNRCHKVTDRYGEIIIRQLTDADIEKKNKLD
jgi:hypothetical protein